MTLKISAPGPVGSKGEKGFKGSPGIKGGTGAPGVNGITGLKGLLGDKGLRGVNGFPGVNGSKGIPGEKGSAGLVGGAGDIGSAGIVGSTGPRGIGNFSWCIERKISASLTHVNQGINEAAVTEDTVRFIYHWHLTDKVIQMLDQWLLLQLSLQAKLLLLTAASRRGQWVNTMENDPLASIMCQNR